MSAQDAVGYTGCALDLEPKAFFGVSFGKVSGMRTEEVVR